MGKGLFVTLEGIRHQEASIIPTLKKGAICFSERARSLRSAGSTASAVRMSNAPSVAYTALAPSRNVGSVHEPSAYVRGAGTRLIGCAVFVSKISSAVRASEHAPARRAVSPWRGGAFLPSKLV
jgi:hypothetical protein